MKRSCGSSYLEDLEANAKDELVMQAIAEDADIHVTEEDVEDYFKTVVHLEDYSAYEQNYGTAVSAPRCPSTTGCWNIWWTMRPLRDFLRVWLEKKKKQGPISPLGRWALVLAF